jgi:paraquat-inducible protein A
VQPHAGALAFAAVVVLTMLATDAYDPRVLWRRPGTPHTEGK